MTNHSGVVSGGIREGHVHREEQVSAIAAVYRPIARHAFSLLLILVVGTLTFRTALDILPLQWDNLYALSIAVAPDPLSLVTEPTGAEPAYRPVALLSIWLQGQFAGLNARPFLVFNQAAWIACAFALYALVHALSHSRVAALVGGLALLLDSRAVPLLKWIDDRQTSLATLAGLLVLLMLTSRQRHRWPRASWFMAFLLLLCSALSKEYGFAFCGATILFALVSTPGQGIAHREHRRDAVGLSMAVLAVAAVYLALRVGLAGGSFTQDLCQEQSFFASRVSEQVCASEMDVSTKAAQYLYNSGAALLGTPMPWLFTRTGALQRPSVSWLAAGFDLSVLCLALIGLIKVPRQTLPLVALVVFQALLSFMLYRTRNQLVGAAGLYASAGIGLAFVLNHLRARQASRVFAGVVVGTLLFVLAFHARDLARTLDQEQQDAMKMEPCRLVNAPLITADLIHRVKRFYGLRNPTCT